MLGQSTGTCQIRDVLYAMKRESGSSQSPPVPLLCFLNSPRLLILWELGGELAMKFRRV
jgi:hypothetical protein